MIFLIIIKFYLLLVRLEDFLLDKLWGHLMIFLMHLQYVWGKKLDDS
jgi:hypothetical protein